MRPYQTILALIFLLTSFPVFAQSFASYTNGRYGFSISYPSDFRMDPSPENDDGRRFTNNQGVSINVFGSNNVLDGSIQTTLESLKGELDHITYRTKGHNWFVISGYKGQEVLYIKVFLGKGASNQVWIQHPKTLTQQFSAATSKIVASFKPGNLNASH